MPDQAVNEMMSAFASGCMDKENFVHFNKYIRSKGDLPYKELGQLQTLISMLPAILEREEPAADLKNRVARRLISMQDEIKEKIKAEKGKTVEVPRDKTRYTKQEQPSEFNFGAVTQIDIPVPVPHKRMEVVKTSELEQNTIMNKENKLFPENITQPQEIPSQVPLWIAAALLFIAIGLVAYYSFSNYNELKDALAKTENSLTLAKSEIRNTNEFINKNAVLIEFFNNENVWVVTLTGTDPRMKISGKLFIAMSEKEALLQINNLPTPPPENIYQLWIVSKNQTYSMGTFFIEPGNRFVKLLNIPVIPKELINQFTITSEPRSGSIIPTGQQFATGQVSEVTKKPGKKN